MHVHSFAMYHACAFGSLWISDSGVADEHIGTKVTEMMIYSLAILKIVRISINSAMYTLVATCNLYTVSVFWIKLVYDAQIIEFDR